MHARELPPLRQHLEIIASNGRRYRWGNDEPDAANVPAGLRYSSTMPGGHENLDVTLPRKPGTDYADLERLSTIRVLGASGDPAWEGRLERAPRVSGDQMAISPSAVGWQAHLDDDKSASMIYVDRALAGWGSAARERLLSSAASGLSYSDVQVAPDATSGLPGLVTAFQGAWVAGARPLSEALYDAGPGNLIARIYYAWHRESNWIDPADTNWIWQVGVAPTDAIDPGFTTGGNLRAAGPGEGAYTPPTPDRYGWLQLVYNAAPAGSDGAPYRLYWQKLAVYGDHRLPLHGPEPAGLLASDIVSHAVSRWAPLLTATGDTVLPSGFVIPHLVFSDPTTAGEIVRQATRFDLQDWAVWDDKTFWCVPRGTAGRSWRTRIAPAQFEETGPQADRLWESIIVAYQDVDGSTRTVGPPGSGADVEDEILHDPDPDNPANRVGIFRRDLLRMGVSTAAAAIEVGRRFLEEQKLLDSSGRAQIVGHVEDDRGVKHPYWRVRAGDRISFVDAADSSYRRIVRADHSHDDHVCRVDLDAPPEGLAALLERLGVALIPLGVS